MIRLSAYMRSMSIGRSEYPFSLFVVLPNLRSMACVASNISNGDSGVVMVNAMFIKLFSDSKPQGWVVYGDDTAVIVPILFSSERVSLICCSLLPIFVPIERVYVIMFVWLI